MFADYSKDRSVKLNYKSVEIRIICVFCVRRTHYGYSFFEKNNSGEICFFVLYKIQGWARSSTIAPPCIFIFQKNTQYSLQHSGA